MADEQPAPTGVLRLRDPQYRDVYANSNAIGLTPFDFTIIFQRIGEFAPGQQGLVDLISVSMSPQQFKGFARVVTETLEAYERVFGTLQVPDQDTAPMRDASALEGIIRTSRDQALALKAKSSSTGLPPPAKRSRAAPRKKVS